MSQLRREPVPPSLWPLPCRERTTAESTLLGLAWGLTFVVKGWAIFQPTPFFHASPWNCWPLLLPTAWFVQTWLRARRGLPFDRTSVWVGLSCFLPYIPEKRGALELGWHFWVGLALSLAAFAWGLRADWVRENAAERP